MAMQFAFIAPYQYAMHMNQNYTEANRHLYFPKTPKEPHATTLRTPADYPKEAKRLAQVAEKLRKRKAKEAAKKREVDAAGEGASSPKKRTRRLRKKKNSPPPAVDEEESDKDLN